MLFIVPAFPKDQATSYMVPFIQQFTTAFVDTTDVLIDIVTLYEPQGATYTWNKVKVIPLNGNMKAGYMNKMGFMYQAARRIAKTLERENYDGILSFWYREAAMIGRLASKKSGVKHITWLLGQDVRSKNKYMRFIRPKSQEIVAISDFQNNELEKAFGFRAHRVVPIAVNPSFFPKIKTTNRSIDILGAGSMIPLKNHHLFLEVVLELVKKKKNLKAMLIGNGPLEDPLKEFVGKHQLQNNIEFPGLLSHTETLKHMNNAKIFLHTSTFEGGCTVCFESLFAGCHLISTLPIARKSNSKFSHLTTKREIVAQIEHLLNVQEPSYQRNQDTEIITACKTFYNLFF